MFLNVSVIKAELMNVIVCADRSQHRRGSALAFDLVFACLCFELPTSCSFSSALHWRSSSFSSSTVSLVTSFSSAKATFSSFSSLFSPLLFPTELVIYNQEWRHWSLFEPASSVSDHSRGCYRRPSLSSASSAQDRVWLGKLRFFQSFGSPHGPHEIAKWHCARLLQSISFIIAFQGWGPERPGHIGADKRLIFQSFGSPYEISMRSQNGTAQDLFNPSVKSYIE